MKAYESVTTKVGFAYNVFYTQTKRCRIQKSFTEAGEMEVLLPNLSDEEFPVALEVGVQDEKTEEVRAYDGLLYRKTGGNWSPNVKLYGDREISRGDFIDGVSVMCYDTRESAESEVRRRYESVVVYHGELWRHTDYVVPYYTVCTFGLGWNHGGTALMVDWTSQEKEFRGENNGFAADDRKNAIRKAVDVAKKRGDTESIDKMCLGDIIRVTMPELLPPRAKLVRRSYVLKKEIVLEGYDEKDFEEKLGWMLQMRDLEALDFAVKSEEEIPGKY